jgi:hypothetical protein
VECGVPLAGTARKMYVLSITVLIVGISLVDAHDEFGILFEKGVFGYCFCEWICGFYFTIFNGCFKYSEF